MREKILAVLRSSEFWMALPAVIVEAVSTPLPPEAQVAKWAAYVYIAARLVSKIAKVVFQAPPAAPPAVLLALAGALLLTPAPARAADLSEVVGIYGAVGGSWSESATDVEAGGTARASLSPHLSAVGGAFYGFNDSYARWSVGARFTATDVDDPTFSVGLGIQYHGASEAISGPRDEWAPDASFGWVPFAERPRLVVVGLACYGLTSESARATLGLRYKFNL